MCTGYAYVCNTQFILYSVGGIFTAFHEAKAVLWVKDNHESAFLTHSTFGLLHRLAAFYYLGFVCV